MKLRLVSLFVFSLAVTLCRESQMHDLRSQTPAFPTLSGEPPLVIAHRGATGYLPEHTLEAYSRAIELGADFIEPDLVSTKDGVLIARHEPWLSDTTDVAAHPEFGSRRTTRLVDGRTIDDWFAADFTLDEIKRLRARQAIAARDQAFNGRYAIPTFAEIIALAKSGGEGRSRIVGIYPETKHPTFHREIGLPLEPLLLDALEREGWTEKSSPVIVQSFEIFNLQYIRTQSNIRLVQLFGEPDDGPFDLAAAGNPKTYLDLLGPGEMPGLTAYADGIGIPKEYLALPDNGQNPDGAELISAAHRAGLFVHAYTFRNEARYRMAGMDGTPEEEYAAFYALGVDGVFSDFPDTALAALGR